LFKSGKAEIVVVDSLQQVEPGIEVCARSVNEVVSVDRAELVALSSGDKPSSRLVMTLGPGLKSAPSVFKPVKCG
jgi:hypothetical protein